MNKIGEGKTATVYSDGQYAYKQYHKDYDINNIHYEIYIQNEIHDHTKLNVAHYEIEDHRIKMTLFDGVIFADRIRIEKYPKWLDDFVNLQCEVFDYQDLNIPNSYEVYAKQVNQSHLDESLKRKALESIDKIKKEYRLCHFDFHPLNIIYGHRQYFIIDWTNAKLGNPAMDIASTYIIFRQYLKRQANKYIKMAMKKTGISKSEILDALPVMAFIKLRENDIPEHENLLRDLILGHDMIYKA